VCDRYKIFIQVESLSNLVTYETATSFVRGIEAMQMMKKWQDLKYFNSLIFCK
jgi:hypothetical protein